MLAENADITVWLQVSRVWSIKEEIWGVIFFVRNYRFKNCFLRVILKNNTDMCISVAVVGSAGRANPDMELEGISNTRESVVRRLLTHCGTGRQCCRFIMAAVRISQVRLWFLVNAKVYMYCILTVFKTTSDTSRWLSLYFTVELCDQIT